MFEVLGLLPFSAGSVWEKIALIALILLVAYIVTLWVTTVMWTYRDIHNRTADRSLQAVCTFLVAVFNIPGLALYLMLRPQETLSDRFERQLEVEAFMRDMRDKPTCPSCRRSTDENFIACPYCKTTIRTACERCSAALDRNWVICPFCGTERGTAEPDRRPETVAAANRGRQPWRTNGNLRRNPAFSPQTSGSPPIR